MFHWLVLIELVTPLFLPVSGVKKSGYATGVYFSFGRGCTHITGGSVICVQALCTESRLWPISWFGCWAMNATGTWVYTDREWVSAAWWSSVVEPPRHSRSESSKYIIPGIWFSTVHQVPCLHPSCVREKYAVSKKGIKIFPYEKKKT